ncbi:MAG: cell division protein FtsZ [Patescibacteria group bacterium]
METLDSIKKPQEGQVSSSRGRGGAPGVFSIIPQINIKVVGLGGGGCSSVNRMASQIMGVDFLAINTDVQNLRTLENKRIKKLRIGRSVTKGLGAGMNPETGKKATENERDKIQDLLRGADLVFITAGLGGGTGTGAFPIIAEAAKRLKALTVGIVTKPFSFEGLQRQHIAEKGIRAIKNNVDSLIIISNDRIFQMIKRGTGVKQAFGTVDKIIKESVQTISDLLVIPGIINIDFADLKAILGDSGLALIGIGKASGNDRASEAARLALASPLLDYSIEGASGLLFNVTGGEDLSMREVEEAAKVLTKSVDPEANIIFGAIRDDTLGNKIRISVIATGLSKEKAKPRPELEEIQQPKLKKKEFEIPAFIRKKMELMNK